MSVPRKSRKRLVGKAIENREVWQRQEEYRAWACDLHRQWRTINGQGAAQLVPYFVPCARFAKS